MLLAIAAFITWNLKGCLTASPPNEKLIRAEIELEHLEQTRLSDSIAADRERAMYDSIISALKTKDAGVVIQYKKSQDAYNKVPSVVISFDKEQLRTEASRYPVPSN